MFSMHRERMFDYTEENIGAAIKTKLFEAFGCYPVLDLSERWDYEEYDDDNRFIRSVNLRDYHAILDTEKIDQIDDFSLGYVKHLMGYMIEERAKKPDLKDMERYTSKKYCFSDTENWWTAMELEGIPEGREIFTFRLELG